ncbi:hypothetical protein ZIOFF_065580 [Zingiber officinale]|uniref:AB hydrolase-1 domain-containing protein n=1 Tax=Zingiber officinale TaxID=94328 RepID=A0A8J5K8Z5_ZINOF|nr:hypothetical protein ZIOFF_065580 [Zingiber officinale]
MSAFLAATLPASSVGDFSKFSAFDRSIRPNGRSRFRFQCDFSRILGAVLAIKKQINVCFCIPGIDRLPFRAEGYNFWTWKGRKIHYVEQGTGQPVVLIHGFGASAFHWRYNIPELAKRYKVYALDLLGFGWSEKAIIDYDATIWRDQVSDFLKEIVKEPAILVGNRVTFIALLTSMMLLQLCDSLDDN